MERSLLMKMRINASCCFLGEPTANGRVLGELNDKCIAGWRLPLGRGNARPMVETKALILILCIQVGNGPGTSHGHSWKD